MKNEIDQPVLLIVDVQYGAFIKPNTITNGERLLRNVKKLIHKARKVGVPIFYIQHCGNKGHMFEENTIGWKIHPFVAPLDDDIIIKKNSPDSFLNTRLKEELEFKQINHIIVTGLQTEFCIDTTCRRAFSLGYKTTLVKNGHSTWNSQNLKATQIIEHHNQILSSCFVRLKEQKEIIF